MSEGEKELPQGWDASTLGTLLPLQYGKALRKDKRNKSGEIPVFGSSGIVGYHDEAITENDCLLVGRKGSAGAVYMTKLPCWPIDTVYYCNISRLLPLRYWYFRLQFEKLVRLDQSTAIPSLSRDNYSAVKTFIPPLAEQNRIIDKIDELFSSIEAGERAIARARTALKRYRKAVLKAAVTGELTADWRAKNPPSETAQDLLARILKARYSAWEKAELEKLDAKGKARPETDKEWVKFRARYKEAAEFDVEGLPELPNGWVWASLAQLCEVKGGVTVNRKREAENPVEIPYLRVANVQAGHIDLTTVKNITVDAAKAKEKYLQSGDILMNEGGDLDKLGRGWVWYGQIHPCIHQNHVFRARPYIAELSSEYISHNANFSIQGFCIKNGKQSVNLASISLTSICKFPTPLQPLDEQAEIVSRVEQALSKADKAEATLCAQAKQAKALKQAVLKTAFEGKLVPQNPNDEPASELLKRIKEEI